MEATPNARSPTLRGVRRRHPHPIQAEDDQSETDEGRVLLRSSARMRPALHLDRHRHRPPPPHPGPPPDPHDIVAAIDSPASNETQSDSSQYESDAVISSYDQGNAFPWYYHWTHDRGGTTTSSSTASRYHRRTTVSASSSTSSFQLTAYVQFLGWTLVAWVVYLLLPRGLRKTYCTTDRRRHRRHRQVVILPNQTQPQFSASATMAATRTRPVSPPLNISVPRIRAREIDRPAPPQLQHQNAAPMKPTNLGGNAAAAAAAAARDVSRKSRPGEYITDHHDAEPVTDDLSRDESLVSLLEDSQLSYSTTTDPSTNPISYYHRYHPAIPTPPSVQILRDTFSRLESGGIRLVAHGIHCESKRVWIRIAYDRLNLPESFAVRWQTEVCRTVTAADGRVSKIWVKRGDGGAGHTLRLRNVLCVDVGKNTSALASKPSLDPTTCLSLLTATGSLDLEARSQLERDAIVCCLSRLLDQVHDVDWRQLYRESPEPSTVTSAVVSTSTFPISIADTSAAVADPESSMDDLSLL